jgi:hypothetical protein
MMELRELPTQQRHGAPLSEFSFSFPSSSPQGNAAKKAKETKHTNIILYKFQRKTQTPNLAPYSFPPSPFVLGIRIFNYPPDLKIFSFHHNSRGNLAHGGEENLFS